MKLFMKISFVIYDQKPRSKTSSKIAEIFVHENYFLYCPKN